MMPKASPTTYRVQQRFRGEVPALVAISMPFVKPGAGSPALLGWRDAQTLFHEFGHALHTLSGDVTRPSLGGGGVVSDSAVFPSKLFEHRLATPEVLSRFAVHHATGQPMPQALVAASRRRRRSTRASIPWTSSPSRKPAVPMTRRWPR